MGLLKKKDASKEFESYDTEGIELMEKRSLEVLWQSEALTKVYSATKTALGSFEHNPIA